MAKKPRHQKVSVFDFSDLERVIKADGWFSVPGTKHRAYKHPTKPGKVNLDAKWRNVKLGSWTFVSVCQQAGLSREKFLDLYWRSR